MMNKTLSEEMKELKSISRDINEVLCLMSFGEAEKEILKLASKVLMKKYDEWEEFKNEPEYWS